MKRIVKIEIVLLVLVVLVAVGMVLVSEGFLNLFVEPVVIEREPVPIPTEAPVTPTEEIPEETEPQQPQDDAWTITATKYFAYDIREGEYLQQMGDGDEKLYPASITKLLTTYTLLQHMQPDDTVTVGDALTLVEEDSSVAELEEGDELTVEQLIAAMMLPSGNDAAQVAAVAAGRAIGGANLSCTEAVEVFVTEMNRQAELLGMENSHFVNPDGWHDVDHYTTMNDLVVLSETVLNEPLILKYTSQVETAVALPDRTLEWANTNFLLDSEMEVYLPNTIGLKTGYTDAAGSCLVSAFFMEDRILLIGVFGCPAYTEDRYLDTVAIYNSL